MYTKPWLTTTGWLNTNNEHSVIKNIIICTIKINDNLKNK